MTKRAAAVAATRQRIVGAALELHASRGIRATSWDDIAARAGVGVGTVYRHFPSLDELIPACGDRALEELALPSASVFEGVREPGERMRRLVREAFSLYERGAGALRAIRREAGVHPRVAEDRDAVERALAALVRAALEPMRASARDRAVVRALIDLGTWEALRDQGLDEGERVEEISGLLVARLAQG